MLFGFNTTSRFRKTAKDAIKGPADCRIVLIEGSSLAELMVQSPPSAPAEPTKECHHIAAGVVRAGQAKHPGA